MTGNLELAFMMVRDTIIFLVVKRYMDAFLPTYFPWLDRNWGFILAAGLLGIALYVTLFPKDENAEAQEKKKVHEEADNYTWKAWCQDWAQAFAIIFLLSRTTCLIMERPVLLWGGWVVYKIYYNILYYVNKWWPKKDDGEPDMKSQKVDSEVKAKLALRNVVLGKVTDGFISQGGLTDPHLPGGVAVGQKWAHGGSWPIVDIRVTPFKFELDENYRLEVEGVGEDGKGKLSLSLKDLESIGVKTYEDQVFHCVTTMSKKDLHFRGIPLKKFIDHCKPPGNWSSFMSFGRDGYSSNVPREECEATDLAEPFLALSHYDPGSGEAYPIEYEHGVIRIFFPRLYGWKGSKWMTKVRFDKVQKLGFWERSGGAHFRGRVDLQERFSTDVWMGNGVKTAEDCVSRDLLQGLVMIATGAWFRLPILRTYALGSQRMLGVYCYIKLWFFDTQDWLYIKIGWKERDD